MTETNLVYHVFGDLVNKSAKRVKGDMEGFILEHYDSVAELIKNFIKPLKLDHYSYITRLTHDAVRPDVMCIYLLCKMYGKHAGIVTERRVWYTFKGDGCVKDCDLVLVFKGANVFANTQPMQLRWKKADKEQNLIFEAGEKVPSEDRTDPDYKPQHRKYRPKLLKRKRERPPSRQAAKTAGRKVRSSYYHDPDYVVDVTSESESSLSDVEIVSEECAKSAKPKKKIPGKGYREKVIGTIKVLQQGSSTEEYDVTQYPGILSFQEAVNQNLIRGIETEVKEIPRVPQHKTVPARTYGVKKKTRAAVKCAICRQMFNNYTECNAHTRQQHGQEFKCSKCHKQFKARRYLLTHLKRHDLQQLAHVCNKCGKRFLRPSDLKEHGAVHSDDTPFHCKWLGCDKSFKLKKDLNKHFIRAHTATPELQCEHCVQTFDDERLYKQHMRTHAEPTIPCPRCGKLFRHYATRNKHARYCKHVIVE